MTAALAAGLVWAAGAEPASAVSDEAALDTRGVRSDAQALAVTADTRSYAVDWSVWVKLNTRRILGTLLLLK
jgi:hypothetical protein